MAKRRMMRNKKGQLLSGVAPESKAKQILTLFMSKITGTAGVEANTVRNILFGVNENLAMVIYDVWNDKKVRHRIERVNEELLEAVKRYRALTDVKKRIAEAETISKLMKEFEEVYVKDINLLSNAWDHHCNLLDGILHEEEILIKWLLTFQKEALEASKLNLLRVEVQRMADTIIKGSGRELALAQATKTGTVSITEAEIRSSDDLDRIIRKLGYRINSLSKRMSSAKKAVEDAFERGDPDSTFNATDSLIKMLATEYAELHRAGMHIGVLLWRLLEFKEQFDKVAFLYQKSNKDQVSAVNQIISRINTAQNQALSMDRAKAQQIELRAQNLRRAS